MWLCGPATRTVRKIAMFVLPSSLRTLNPVAAIDAKRSAGGTSLAFQARHDRCLRVVFLKQLRRLTAETPSLIIRQPRKI